MNTLQKICLVFTIIGALNWGLVGLFDLNLATLVFGADTTIGNAFYLLIGLCGIINTGLLFTQWTENK